MRPPVILIADYAGPYADHPDFTPLVKACAEVMLSRVNRLREMAAADGVPFPLNRYTGSGVSGSGNGGFRPQTCPIGAPRSKHKLGRGVDSYDPGRYFASWCLASEDRLAECGLWGERVEWTPTWVHLQDLPASNPAVRFFIPDTTPPKAGLPPAWDLLRQQLKEES